MSGERLQRKVTVTNPQGFHLRTMTAFARLAQQFKSSVTVSNGPVRADGKSPLMLMAMLAEQGTELTVEVEGPDASEALGPLCNVIAAPTDELAGA
jgi:phosphocarrier protein HPr